MSLATQITDWAPWLTRWATGASLSLLLLVPSSAQSVALRPPRPIRQQVEAINTLPDGEIDIHIIRYPTPTGLEPAQSVGAESALPIALAEPNPAATLRDISGLSPDILAQLIGVSRITYFKWLKGGGIRAGNAAHLARLLTIFRAMRDARGAGLPEFLATAGVAGRPLDLLLQGNNDLALGLALRIPSRPQSTAISGQARQASGVPGWLRPVSRLGWQRPGLQGDDLSMALARYSPRPLTDTAAVSANDEEPTLQAFTVLVS
jgi:hypothetical protein